MLLVLLLADPDVCVCTTTRRRGHTRRVPMHPQVGNSYDST